MATADAARVFVAQTYVATVVFFELLARRIRQRRRRLRIVEQHVLKAEAQRQEDAEQETRWRAVVEAKQQQAQLAADDAKRAQEARLQQLQAFREQSGSGGWPTEQRQRVAELASKLAVSACPYGTGRETLRDELFLAGGALVVKEAKAEEGLALRTRHKLFSEAGVHTEEARWASRAGVEEPAAPGWRILEQPPCAGNAVRKKAKTALAELSEQVEQLRDHKVALAEARVRLATLAAEDAASAKAGQRTPGSKPKRGSTLELHVPRDVARLGLALDRSYPPEPVRVATVEAGSWGDSEGVLVGDEMTEINGRAVNKMRKDEIRPALRVRPLTFVLRRSDSEDPELVEEAKGPSIYEVYATAAVETLGFAPSGLPPNDVLVAKVDDGGWAEQQGVKVDDTLLEVHGFPIFSMGRHNLRQALRARPLRLVFARTSDGLVSEGKRFVIRFPETLGKVGFTLSEAYPPEPVLVDSVEDPGWAHSEGIQVGDVLVALGGRLVENLRKDQLMPALQERPLRIIFERRPVPETVEEKPEVCETQQQDSRQLVQQEVSGLEASVEARQTELLDVLCRRAWEFGGQQALDIVQRLQSKHQELRIDVWRKQREYRIASAAPGDEAGAEDRSSSVAGSRAMRMQLDMEIVKLQAEFSACEEQLLSLADCIVSSVAATESARGCPPEQGVAAQLDILRAELAELATVEQRYVACHAAPSPHELAIEDVQKLYFEVDQQRARTGLSREMACFAARPACRESADAIMLLDGQLGRVQEAVEMRDGCDAQVRHLHVKLAKQGMVSALSDELQGMQGEVDWQTETLLSLLRLLTRFVDEFQPREQLSRSLQEHYKLLANQWSALKAAEMQWSDAAAAVAEAAKSGASTPPPTTDTPLHSVAKEAYQRMTGCLLCVQLEEALIAERVRRRCGIQDKNTLLSLLLDLHRQRQGLANLVALKQFDSIEDMQMRIAAAQKRVEAFLLHLPGKLASSSRQRSVVWPAVDAAETLPPEGQPENAADFTDEAGRPWKAWAPTEPADVLEPERPDVFDVPLSPRTSWPAQTWSRFDFGIDAAMRQPMQRGREPSP
eukprot:TRINITY_DN32214_c0_g1_i1.p1 TRINITY_DN32214_c0_g1~~TRINITY_DN32214_c0_g1_i1.p1  ORF type:complete len:1072 (+),score=263.66 TRINITY_DN32214_c0_g1_i1:63-3278(+)